MLQDIRDKSQGWIAKTIIGVIVLLLGLTGFEAIFRAVGHDKEVASVNGEGVTTAEFNSTYEQQRYILSRNGQFDGSPEAVKQLKKMVVDNLINYRLLIQAADNAGFGYLPEGFIKQEIQQNPMYQTNGQFDYSLFEQDFRNYGYASDQQFVKDQLERRYLTQLQSGIIDARFATEDQTLAIAKLLEQTRDFSYKELKATDIANINNEEINAWYEQHKDTLKTPEQVVIEYIELKKSNFTDKATVSEQELKDLYNKKIIDLDKSSVRKRIAHILIPITASQPEEQAKAKIDEIAKELQQGKDFAAVAKQDSQDTGTANNGGDLGFVTDDDLPDPQAFAPVLSTLEKAGDISAPVRSRFGWHIIKLTDVQKASIPSFESMHDQLASELKQQKAYDSYLNAQRDLDKMAYESYDNLASVADQLKLPLTTSKPFARDAGYDAVTSNEKVIKAAFTETILNGEENSSIIELSPDTSLVLRVKEHLQPSVMTLEQATPVITKTLQEEKVKAQGEQLIADIKAGKAVVGNDWQAFETVKQPIQLTAEEFTKLAIAPEVLEELFAIPKPADNKLSVQGVTLKNGNYAIIALTTVNEFKETLSTEQKAQYRDVASTDAANKLWDEYQKYLKDKAEIKYFEAEQ